MTLSLDDVRNKRFRMARKSGYEVLEVDEFVDEVEASFAQLLEENQNLKKQVDSLKQTAVPGTQPRQPAAPAAASQPAPRETIVVTTAKEASSAVVRLVELSTEQAERLVAEATEEANRIREETDRSVKQLTTDARTRAERVESEARVNAERVQSDAVARAERVDQELEKRRAQLFGDLEKQRDQLGSTVNELRKFEAAYRASLTDYLRGQMEAVQSGKAEPPNAPPIAPRPANQTAPAPAAEGANQAQGPADRGTGASDTPRLDALLGDQR